MTTDSPTIRVAVLGAGGVGLLLSSVLARTGHHVTVIARPDTATHLQRNGIVLRSPSLGHGQATVSVETRLTSAVDFVVVAVKAPQLDNALHAVPSSTLDQGFVVPMLNGIEHLARLRQVYPPRQVVAGAIRVEATRTAPGVVEHSSPFADVTLAAAHGGARRRLAQLTNALRAGGITVTVTDDEQGVLWSKLAALAPVALITTATNAPLGEALATRGDEVTTIVHEVVAVAASHGVTLDAETTLTFVRDRMPPGFRSSMQRDAQAGRQIELDAIGWAILRAAERSGVDAPVTARVVREISGR